MAKLVFGRFANNVENLTYYAWKMASEAESCVDEHPKLFPAKERDIILSSLWTAHGLIASMMDGGAISKHALAILELDSMQKDALGPLQDRYRRRENQRPIVNLGEAWYRKQRWDDEYNEVETRAKDLRKCARFMLTHAKRAEKKAENIRMPKPDLHLRTYGLNKDQLTELIERKIEELRDMSETVAEQMRLADMRMRIRDEWRETMAKIVRYCEGMSIIDHPTVRKGKKKVKVVELMKKGFVFADDLFKELYGRWWPDMVKKKRFDVAYKERVAYIKGLVGVVLMHIEHRALMRNGDLQEPKGTKKYYKGKFEEAMEESLEELIRIVTLVVNAVVALKGQPDFPWEYTLSHLLIFLEELTGITENECERYVKFLPYALERVEKITDLCAPLTGPKAFTLKKFLRMMRGEVVSNMRAIKSAEVKVEFLEELGSENATYLSLRKSEFHSGEGMNTKYDLVRVRVHKCGVDVYATNKDGNEVFVDKTMDGYHVSAKTVSGLPVEIHVGYKIVITVFEKDRKTYPIGGDDLIELRVVGDALLVRKIEDDIPFDYRGVALRNTRERLPQQSFLIANAKVELREILSVPKVMADLINGRVGFTESYLESIEGKEGINEHLRERIVEYTKMRRYMYRYNISSVYRKNVEAPAEEALKRMINNFCASKTMPAFNSYSALMQRQYDKYANGEIEFEDALDMFLYATLDGDIFKKQAKACLMLNKINMPDYKAMRERCHAFCELYKVEQLTKAGALMPPKVVVPAITNDTKTKMDGLLTQMTRLLLTNGIDPASVNIPLNSSELQLKNGDKIVVDDSAVYNNLCVEPGPRVIRREDILSAQTGKEICYTEFDTEKFMNKEKKKRAKELKKKMEAIHKEIRDPPIRRRTTRKAKDSKEQTDTAQPEQENGVPQTGEQPKKKRNLTTYQKYRLYEKRMEELDNMPPLEALELLEAMYEEEEREEQDKRPKKKRWSKAQKKAVPKELRELDEYGNYLKWNIVY